MTKLQYEIPDEEHILEISKKVLLSPEETNMWCVHLGQVHENRVSGAKKRAKNAASKKKQSKKVGSKPAKTKPKENLKRLVDSNETEVCVALSVIRRGSPQKHRTIASILKYCGYVVMVATNGAMRAALAKFRDFTALASLNFTSGTRPNFRIS